MPYLQAFSFYHNDFPPCYSLSFSNSFLVWIYDLIKHDHCDQRWNSYEKPDQLCFHSAHDIINSGIIELYWINSLTFFKFGLINIRYVNLSRYGEIVISEFFFF